LPHWFIIAGLSLRLAGIITPLSGR